MVLGKIRLFRRTYPLEPTGLPETPSTGCGSETHTILHPSFFQSTRPVFGSGALRDPEVAGSLEYRPAYRVILSSVGAPVTV